MLIKLFTIYNDSEIEVFAEQDIDFEAFTTLALLKEIHGKDAWYNEIDYDLDDYDELNPN
jgi:hypothetical protein